MDSCLDHFALFPLFPVEIRLNIWNRSFPEPRIIDLKLINSKGESLNQKNRTIDGPWHWASTSSFSLPLLQVNHEARRLMLQSYKPTNICQQNGAILYIDFERDTVYRACYQCDPLFQFDLTHDTVVSNASSWTSNVTNLALHLTVFKGRDASGQTIVCPSLDTFSLPSARQGPLRNLHTVCMHFPALRKLWIVIDGRDDQFVGKDEIVDPSPQHGDWFLHIKMVDALGAIELVVEDSRNQQPDSSLPQINLGLLTNGQDNELATRRWYYDFAGRKFEQPTANSGRFFRAPGDSDSESSGLSEDDGDFIATVLDSDGRAPGTFHCIPGHASDSDE
ncbi:uncharacterized protein LY89DRAFT_740166 [Mollisia scopiformis]|uniref:2EXR domain-containing protein n=1 Tax=Mollisia scopiformis TaxID=149040 RepID=A0A132BDF0_MOLSC|nr:uncharacterized protein LY89DRAFT_740166 [Mollisia scopiformis]KUJ10455.1 hypothetical protein LY89DRAFT_740166 [Mollisia scopiformis]